MYLAVKEFNELYTEYYKNNKQLSKEEINRLFETIIYLGQLIQSK
ncbi:MAG: hypothetical protein PHE29_12420 [Tissierellia bacterium]|nr:hypothetical protein [Tissierellia bacterium]MDD4779063.1 hypothetical protein [Tissierellia bacterium]